MPETPAGDARIPGPPLNILLVASDDVSRSLGRPGFLEARSSGSNRAPLLRTMAEPAGRLDVLAQRVSSGDLIEALSPPFGLEEWLASMAQTHLVDPAVALVVMSMADDFAAEVWRHRQTDLLLQPTPDYLRTWPPEALDWLREGFVSQPPPLIEDIETGLRSMARRVASIGASLMVYNVSTYVPAEVVHSYRPDSPETRAERAHRIDLMLDALAPELDLVVVDVDRIVAELGAGDQVDGPGRYRAEACEAIGENALTAMRDVAALAGVFGSEVMRLTVPSYDRRTVRGEIVAWHRNAPGPVTRGDRLFDVRFDNLYLKHPQRQRDKKNRSLTVSVVAARDGYLRDILCPVGAMVDVGTTAAVVAKDDIVEVADTAAAAEFPVGVRVHTR